MTDSTPHGGSHRLFFALWPADDVRSALAQAADRVAQFACGRRTATSKLHLTLHYLGNWADPREVLLARASAAADAVQARAFHLVIDHAGSFVAARVGWLAPAGNSGLDALWSDLGRALGEAGVTSDAQTHFSPHVTVRRDIRSRLPSIATDPISWPVQDFVLVHSHDGRYDVLARWPLAAA